MNCATTSAFFDNEMKSHHSETLFPTIDGSLPNMKIKVKNNRGV
jgi:hypothetical protein